MFLRLSFAVVRMGWRWSCRCDLQKILLEWFGLKRFFWDCIWWRRLWSICGLNRSRFLPFCDGYRRMGWEVGSSWEDLRYCRLAWLSLLPFPFHLDVLSWVYQIFSLVVRWSDIMGLTYFSQPMLYTRCVLNLSYFVHVLLSIRVGITLLSPYLNLLIVMDDSIWHRTNTFRCLCTSLWEGKYWRYACPSRKESGCSKPFPFLWWYLQCCS